jgi:hypothetical protein
VAGEYLPPVVTRLTADIGDFIAKMEAAKAALSALKEAEASVAAAMAAKSAAAQLQAGRLGDLGSALAIASGMAGHLGDSERNLVVVLVVVNAAVAAQADELRGLAGVLAITAAMSGVLALNESDLAAASARAALGTSSQALALRELGGQLAITSGAALALRGAENDLWLTMIEKSAAAAGQSGQLRGLSSQFLQTAAAATVLNFTENNVTRNVDNVSNSVRRGIGWWGLTRNAIHWIISGSAELLAVLIPATVAASAWALVWMQGSAMVQQHMTALYNATEALGQKAGQTFGNFLGLKSSLQAAQDAANPDVYQALGGALNTVKETSGGLAQAGLSMGRIFDTFMGRLVYDFSSAGKAGSTLHTALKSMVPDLTGLGQVFGNLGHGLALFAVQMPGLAEVLLHTLAGVLGLATGLLQLSSDIHVGGVSLITLVLGFEEVNRWGGLLVNLFGRMGMASETLATGMFSPARAAGVLKNVLLALPMGIATLTSTVGSYMTKAASAESATGRLGLAMRNVGADATDAMAGMSTWTALGIAAAAVAIGFLIYKLASAKSSAQEFGDTLQAAVNKAGNLTVLSTIGSNLSALQGKLNETKAGFDSYAVAAGQAGDSSRRMGTGALSAVSAVSKAIAAQQTYHGSQIQQIQDASNVVAGAQKISSMFGLSVPEAMAAADQANVKLSKGIMTQSGHLNALGEKVANLMSGYHAMGVSQGQVGSDMLAMAIDSGLAGTKVSQLTQAWQQLMQNVTGGTASLGAVTTELQNIGQITTSVAGKFGETQKTYNLTTGQFANALKSFSGLGAQAWQNFDNVLGQSMPKLLNWFQTAQAEGAIAGPSFSKAVLDMTAPLVPFAAKSKVAQAELLTFAQSAGLNIKTFPQLQDAINKSGASAKDLQTKVGNATIAMGNMGQVAQNLGNVMNSDFTTAISTAALKAVGFSADTTKLADAIQKFGANSPQAEAAARRLTSDWDKAQKMAGQIATQAHNAQTAIDAMHGKTITINSVFATIGAPPSLPGSASPFVKGHAAGTSNAERGWAMVGEKGPELEYFSGGERVIPNGSGSGGAPSPAPSSGAPHSSGVGSGSEVHVYMDGQELFSNFKTRTRQYNINNGNRSPSGAVSGTMVPR